MSLASPNEPKCHHTGPVTEIDENEPNGNIDASSRRSARLKQRLEFANLCKSNATVIIDCEFDSYESEKESTSLANQVAQAYGANRRAAHPIHLVICGIKQGGYLDQALHRISGTESWQCQLMYEPLQELFDPRNLVYLSADAPEPLEDVLRSETYVIGGIVDRNRLKGITVQKARDIGAMCKRLPIKEHLKLTKSHILSVTACLNALLLYLEYKDWHRALLEAIPKRKLI